MQPFEKIPIKNWNILTNLILAKNGGECFYFFL